MKTVTQQITEKKYREWVVSGVMPDQCFVGKNVAQSLRSEFVNRVDGIFLMRMVATEKCLT